MSSCACQREMPSWSFETFWRDERAVPCATPGCGRDRAKEAQESTARLEALAVTGTAADATLAPAAAERTGVALTLFAIGCAVFCVAAALVNHLTI